MPWYLFLLFTCLATIERAVGQDQYAYIAFVNDVHNRLEEEDPTTSTPCSPKARAGGTCVGGWPRISTAVKSLRLQAQQEGAAFFFLDAGDEFTGTVWDAVYEGQIVAPRLLNMVGPDVMTLGNHEFNYGLQHLATFIGNLSFPVLGACNIDTSNEPTLRGKLRQHVVLRHGRLKVGVIGWITPSTGESSKDVGGVKFQPIRPAVTACLAELKRQHPDLHYIIGLSHSGYSDDLITAREVPGLDLIVGGHSHTFLYTPTTAGPIVTKGPGVNASTCVAKGACDLPAGPYPTWSNSSQGIPVVQAYYSSKYLGLVKVNLSKRQLVPGVLPLLLGGANSSNNVQQDPDLLAVLQKYRDPVDALQTKVVGKTLVHLEGEPSISRTNETNLGNYVCDAFVRSVAKQIRARAGGQHVICLLNAGAIRSGFKMVGNLTVGTVLTMLPYANAVSLFTVKGAALLANVAHGLSKYPSGPRFLQVSGMRYLHTSGSLNSAVLLNPDGSTAAINPGATYTVVSTDYLLQGGDAFNFKDAEVLMPAGLPYAAQVMEDLKLFPQGIAPVTENRIIDCGRWPSFSGCPSGQPAARSSSPRQLLQG